MQSSAIKYRSFFENSVDAMLMIENGIFVDCNAAAVTMLGYASKEEIINLPPFKLSPKFQPDGRSSFDKAAEMIQLAKTRGSHRFEWDHLRKDGTIIPVEVSLTAIKTDNKVHLHTVWRDISNRRRTQAALQESEERFRQIFAANPDPVILAELENGRIIDVNRAFERLTGIAKAEAIGLNSEDLGLWADPERRAPFLRQLHEDGEVNNLEAEFRVFGGLSRTGLLSARRVNVNNSQCMLIVVRDISLEKEAERALMEMDQMKNEFISTAAHELRTPLSAMMGFTELLLDHDFWGEFSEAQRQDFLSEIYGRGEALSRIIDDLLDISRIESGNPITLDLQPTDLGELLGKVVKLFRVHNQKHKFQLDLQEMPESPVMRIDKHRIIQVLENLLSNAVKYSPQGGDILVVGRSVPDGCEISVRDNGIGMTREQLDRIFDKFYRANGSDAAVSGLGLGMSIARQIVEAHGGEIFVDSRLGEWTRVSFRLPLSIDTKTS